MSKHFIYADRRFELFSKALHRTKIVDIFLPPHFSVHKHYPLVILNDGQESQSLKAKELLQGLYAQGILKELILVAVHANNRMREYGTAGIPDCHDRGDQAHLYTQFIIRELFPFLKRIYHVDPNPENHAIVGMSLGGLSAMDIALNHPEYFKKVGVFSGSFWWRSRELGEDYSPNDRIMHRLIGDFNFVNGLKFWIQVGTHDEESDRNNSGIIDAVEDTLDILQMLIYKGYKMGSDIRYVELENGEHNYKTWSAAFPDFLLWHYGK